MRELDCGEPHVADHDNARRMFGQRRGPLLADHARVPGGRRLLGEQPNILRAGDLDDLRRDLKTPHSHASRYRIPDERTAAGSSPPDLRSYGLPESGSTAKSPSSGRDDR